jgi:hypothetical protein
VKRICCSILSHSSRRPTGKNVPEKLAHLTKAPEVCSDQVQASKELVVEFRGDVLGMKNEEGNGRALKLWKLS